MIVGAVVRHAGFDFVELILRILAWAVQIGCVLLLAAIFAVIVWMAEEALRKKRGKFLPRFLVMVLLVCVLLAAFAVEPPVICPDRYERYLNREALEAVRSSADGLYSRNIPLVPVCVRVTDASYVISNGEKGYRVEYTVYYFCLGSREMSYSTGDGYNAESLF